MKNIHFYLQTGAELHPEHEKQPFYLAKRTPNGNEGGVSKVISTRKTLIFTKDVDKHVKIIKRHGCI